MTLANRITIARMLAIPALIIALLNQRFQAALLIGGLIGIGDALDGMIARAYHQQTELGRFIDPMADKVLLLSTYGCLVHLKIIPSWVLVIIASRDILVSAGWGLIFILVNSSEVTTSFSGKCCTAAQMVYAALVLVSKAFPEGSAPWLEPRLGPLQAVMVALTLVSMLDYTLLGCRRLGRKA